MYINKRIIAFALTILLLLGLCACGGNNNNAIIYYEAETVPSTLDPQLAQSESELLMVRNLFEGLMRVNENGEVVNGIAVSYEYINFIYTFKLSDSATWSDGTPITADDFVFALRRAVDPATKAPFSNKLLSIVNADSILSGSISADQLGVKAVDPLTLQIKMKTEDQSFLYTLASSVCMPCSRDFFESCEGQYGLSKDKILTNGSYRLTKWAKDTFAARLYRNDRYYGDFSAKNTAIYISYNPEVSNIKKLKDSSVDIARIKNADIEAAKQAKLHITSNENVLWVVRVGDAFSFDLRKAFITSINPEIYTPSLSDGYSVATSYFPSSIIGSEVTTGIPTYNITEAKQLYESAIKKYDNKKLPSTTLYYLRDDEVSRPISNIVAHWQGQLGAYINIQPCSSVAEIENTISLGGNAIYIYPIKITDSDVSAISGQLGYDFNNIGYKSVDEYQRAIASDYKIHPIIYESALIAHTDDITSFNSKIGNGQTDFSFVTKK